MEGHKIKHKTPRKFELQGDNALFIYKYVPNIA